MEKEEKKEKKKSFISFKIIKKIVYFIVLAALILLIFNKCSRNRVTLDASSNLIKVEEITKFNVAKFTWNGIAEYRKEGSDKVDTYIKYEADITATMNLENFDKNIVIDKDKKEITINLPKVELKPNVIFRDGGKSFSFIPTNTDIEMKELVKVCEDDVIKKVSERVKMQDLAKENAKSTIEGLLLPLVEGNNYKIIWKDGE